MRFLAYLAIYIVMQLLAYLITPLLPLFMVYRYGPINNNNGESYEPRLPIWLSWFDTPDNSLWGDSGWRTEHCPNYNSYWGMVKWLYRNSLYGMSWSLLAAPIKQDQITWQGDLYITSGNGGQFGKIQVQMGNYWQYKSIFSIKRTSYCLQVEFGWVLDPYCKKDTLWLTEPRALFTASPRLIKIK